MKRASEPKKPRKKTSGCVIIIGIIVLLAALGAAASGNKPAAEVPSEAPTLKPIIVMTAKPTQASAPATLVPPTAVNRSQVAAPVVAKPTNAPAVNPPPATVEPAAPVVSDAPASGYVCDNGEACIKGNINDKGLKLYHLPVGCPSYPQTKIDTSAGERMFATEADAIAAGWTKSNNCK